MKVIKSYSLDVEVAQRLDDLHIDAFGPIGSRSRTVNDALIWYLGDEKVSIAQLHQAIEALQRELRQKDPSSVGLEGQKSWWRKILGL